jgi:alpha-tubulin suppressor-like RCC1 family protein
LSVFCALAACGSEEEPDAATDGGRRVADATSRDAAGRDAESLEVGYPDSMTTNPDASEADATEVSDGGGPIPLVAERVVAARDSSCALSGSALWCWGQNTSGSLGLGSAEERVLFPQRLAEDGWTSVDFDGDHACGLRDDEVWCMGENRDGALGLGDTDDRDRPSRVAGSDWTAADVGALHSCGIQSGALYCWGSNAQGQLGLGLTTDPESLPARVGMLDDWTEVAAGGAFTCAVRAGEVQCFGSNQDGQLGRGHARDEAENYTPAAIAGTGYTGLTAGARHACALRGADLYCWGDNFNGQIGNAGDETDVLSPVLVGGGWTSVSAGLAHCCGLKQDALYCWGNGLAGRLGNDMPGQSRVAAPVLIESTGWSAVSAGGEHSCGVRGGEVYCWGSDLEGQLGLGSATFLQGRPTPVLVY